MSDESTLTIRLAGDVMLGRLCDQLMPIHVDDRVERSHAWGLIVSRGGEPLIRKIKQQQHKYAWGDTLPLWSRSASDLRIINLETSVTSTNDPWPDKAFNYRMHPDNIQILKEANIDYCSLANNHTLDYKEIGLHDTMRTLERAQIAYAGVGLTREAAKKPAILHAKGKVIGCFSFSDHPVYFAATDTREGINFLDIAHLTPSERARVRHDMVKWRQELGIDVIIVSLHWGSNYAWTPPASFTDFAHFLIDECRVDVIHGHSSHHVQGIEIYKSKAIIYGCGDLIDDYAVDDNYRNDLSFIYTLTLDLSPNKIQHHRIRTIHLIPTHCQLMSITTSLTKRDHEWLMMKMNKLCKKMGTDMKWNEDGTGIIKCTSDIVPPSTPISLSRSLQSLTPTSTSTSRLIMKRSSISEGMRDMSSSRSSSPRRHSLSVSPTSTTSTTSTSSSTSTSPIASGSNSASTTPTSFTSRLSAFLWSNKKDEPMTNEMKPEEKM